MEMSFGSRLKHVWNAFTGNVQTNYRDLGMSYSYRADRPRMSRGNERSIVTSVYNRIALDVAALNVQHVRLDENGRFLSVIDDGLNNCLTLEANVDQTARSFVQDVVISMFDEGSVAIVPVDTTTDPNVSGSYDIQSLRVGQILDWYPQYIRARVYNEQTGRKEDIVVPKSAVAIIENPLYAVINEPNSTMQRLIRKLNLLDVIDEQSGSGKLDLIIQLPYVIKTEARRQQAENRRKDIENQLSGSKYGIAYTDGTEHITQLNRSVNNNLMSQIEYLTSMLYSQLGITQSILDGTADEKTMLKITVPAAEFWDEIHEEFIYKKEQTLQLEHSLVSLSKWESKWNKAFLGKQEKTDEEILDYVRCMTLTQNIDPEVYTRLSAENYAAINAYIEAPMTATCLIEDKQARGHKETVTSELIYYWMISYNIPVEFQKWHLNRLLTLIRVCNVKNSPPKRRSKREMWNRNAAINAANRKRFGSKG